MTINWIRLFGSVLTAINFAALALALIFFLRRHDIGHRTLLRLVILFCCMVASDNIFAAWNIYHHHREWYAMMRLGTAMYGSMCFTYFMVVNRDLIRTLRISELWDRLRKDKLDDRAQAREQMIYASFQTRAISEGVLARSKL